MPIKSIYSYSEDEFIFLKNEDIEEIILKLIKLKNDKDDKNYYQLILKKFKENNYKEKNEKSLLFKELFDYETRRSFLLKNAEANGKIKGYWKVVRGQFFFSIFISVAFGVIVGSQFSFFDQLLTILGFGVFGSLVVFLLLQIFLLPSNMAHMQQHPDKGLILLINLFGGGFGLPWLIIMYWVTSDRYSKKI